MPFLSLNTNASNLAEYYNNITSNGTFSGTSANPNVTGTSKPNIPNIQYVDFDDGLIRGGLTNVGISVAKDTIRLGKFLTGIDTNTNVSLSNIGQGVNATKGFLFLTKQAGLQLSNPRLEWDRSNPIPPFLGGVNRQFTGAGLIESVAGTAFGLHFDQTGLLGIVRSNQKYGGDINNITSGIAYVNNFGNNNGNTDILGDIEPRNRLVRYLRKIVDIDSSEGTSILLDRYFGGSNSVYGLGYTSIRTSGDTRTTIRTNDLGVPEQTVKTEQQIPLYASSPIDTTSVFGMFGSNVPSLSTTTIADTVIPAISPNPDLSLKLNGFTPSTNKDIASVSNITDKLSPSIPIPTTPSVQNISVPGYNIENRFGVSTYDKLDSINTINIVDSGIFYSNEGKDVSTISTPNIYANSNVQGNFAEDLIKFRIEFLNNEKLLTTSGEGNDKKTISNTDILAFRAYIDDFNDGMSAKWSSYRYMGRGEEFYIYDGFTRDISVAFTIHAHSEAEMAPLYNKLNYLMSAFTPDYSSEFKMRGNIAYLTVGDYVYRQPGIFTDIKIGGFMESSWDTGLNDDGSANGQYQVPRMLKVGLSFKPIHTFLPRRNYSSKQASGKIGQNFPAPFITPDRNAYPIKNADGEKISNSYLTMIDNSSSDVPSDNSSTAGPDNVKVFQDWLDTKHPGWFNGGNLNKGKGYGTYGPKTKSAWGSYQNEYKVQRALFKTFSTF